MERQDGERTCTTPGNPSGDTCASPNPTYASTYGYNVSMEITCMTPPNTAGVTCANPSSSYSTFYQYNGQGLRTEELSPGKPMEYFTYNVESFVPQLLMDGSNAYIYGPQGTALGTAPVEQISLSAPNSQSSVTYLVSDPEGVRLTFNSSGTITAGATYSAYGQVIAGGLSSITPFGYAGGYTDPTGLIYLINRYYDPSTGQFLSVDPLVGITDQPYQYAGGDPVNFTDPLGLACWAALEFGLTQASRNCWKSGYKRLASPDYYYVCLTYVFVQGCLAVSKHGGIILSPGLRFGVPGVSGGAGYIDRRHESACQINQFLQGPTLDASGGYGLGGSIVWGNEGHTRPGSLAEQFGLTTPGIGYFQEWGIQLWHGNL